MIKLSKKWDLREIRPEEKDITWKYGYFHVPCNEYAREWKEHRGRSLTERKFTVHCAVCNKALPYRLAVKTAFLLNTPTIHEHYLNRSKDKATCAG